MDNITTSSYIKSLEDQYLKKDWAAVRDLLLKHKKEYPSGQFHYNLGTIYAKLGDNGASRFNLEKAISKGYIQTESLHNLNIVEKHVAINSKPISLLEQAGVFSSSAYLSLTLFFFLAVLLLKRLGVLKKKLTTGFLFLFCLLPVLSSILYFSKIERAIVLKESNLYEGPSEAYEARGKIPAGVKVVLGKSFNKKWRLIESPKEAVGWIHIKTLGNLKD